MMTKFMRFAEGDAMQNIQFYEYVCRIFTTKNKQISKSLKIFKAKNKNNYFEVHACV